MWSIKNTNEKKEIRIVSFKTPISMQKRNENFDT